MEEANIPITSKNVSMGIPLSTWMLRNTLSVTSGWAGGLGCCADMLPDIRASRNATAAAVASFMREYGSIRTQGGDMRVILAFATVSVGILLAASISLEAHHSFSATYDGNKPITLRGTIVKMGWQNPHAHLYVDVKNA